MLGFAALGVGVSCASGQTECQANTWSGNCALVSATKVRESEFPLPNVTFEGLYRPQPVQGAVNLLPPDGRKEFTALSKYEDALRAHIEATPLVRCYINPPPPGQCQPGALVIEAPEFDALRAQATPTDTGPRGCAQIEAASSQDRVAQAQQSSVAINERFLFAQGSADLPGDAAAALDALAQRLKQSGNLQCLGVVGSWVRGEALSVAFARARAVREELIKRGVEAERMVALTVDPPPLGTSGVVEAAQPSDRRVTISVLLDLPPGR